MTEPGRGERIDVAALPDVRAHVESIEAALRAAGLGEAAERYPVWAAAVTSGAITRMPDGTVHLLTGDIPAMWLRDSSAQVRAFWPVVTAQPSGPVAEVVAGVLARQVQQLAHDPYANAFTDGIPTHHRFDRPRPVPPVWERKWEIDSVAYALDLWGRWWRATGDDGPLGAPAADVLRSLLALLRVEQDPETRSDYSFRRPGAGLTRRGRGPAVRPCGLVRSAFRPSDDPCTHGFLVPSNAHLVVALRSVAELARAAWEPYGGDVLAAGAEALADEVDAALLAEAVDGDGVLAYEIDGFGSRLFMDDANIPSLLSLPYLGWRPFDDEVVVATREAVLSDRNPWFVDGPAVRGVGSPHTARGTVWPMAIAMEGLTAHDADEAAACLDRLVALAGHLPGARLVESVYADRPDRFTRPWFGWPNALACELAEAVLASA